MPRLSGTGINLSGMTALVTGGSRGIGAAISLMLAEAGADIALTYVSHRQSAARIARKVREKGRECISLKADAAKASDIRKAVRMTMREFGRIDILVNNAGIWKEGQIGKMTEREWDETLDVNLKGTFLFCNEVVPIMKKQRGGRIINISSTAGQRGEPFHSHYAASKAGMIGFTKAISVELAPYNILANCIAPGWVDTDMSREPLDNRTKRKRIEAEIPRGYIATAEDVAGAALFLASDFALHLVGSTVSVNGGSVLVG